jgi:hypothetical protein
VVNGGKIAAIIDWGFSGWHPEYWEYTKAHFDFGLIAMPERREELGASLPRYDDEVSAERALWRWCDQPGIPL